MNLSELIWQNWNNWTDGGVDEELIAANIDTIQSELDSLYKWINLSYKKSRIAVDHLSPKFIVDLTSWCLYGTDSSIYLLKDLRNTQIERAASNIGVPCDVLNDLLVNITQIQHLNII